MRMFRERNEREIPTGIMNPTGSLSRISNSSFEKFLKPNLFIIILLFFHLLFEYSSLIIVNRTSYIGYRASAFFSSYLYINPTARNSADSKFLQHHESQNANEFPYYVQLIPSAQSPLPDSHTDHSIRKSSVNAHKASHSRFHDQS